MLRPIFIALTFLLIIKTGRGQENRYSFSASKIGSPFNIILYTKDSVTAANTASASFALVDSLVNIFSDYIDSSELSRLSSHPGKPMHLSPALYDLLIHSQVAYKKSEGTFDITVGPLSKLWRKARKSNVFPGADAVKDALHLTGFDKIKIDTIAHTLVMSQPGMQLDPGGIAQGYIAQAVINYIKEKQIRNALVDVSGDIVAIGAPPGAKGWAIGINKPGQKETLLKHHLLISNKAVSTSGDVYQFMEHNNKRYSHIIDPRTGYGITAQKNVTVIAADGTTADWLTKACSILPLKKAIKLAKAMDAALLVNTIKKGRIISYTNHSFRTYLQN